MLRIYNNTESKVDKIAIYMLMILLSYLSLSIIYRNGGDNAIVNSAIIITNNVKTSIISSNESNKINDIINSNIMETNIILIDPF